MTPIPLSDHGGKDFDVYENLNELPLKHWERFIAYTLEETPDFLSLIKDTYGINKKEMRRMPRYILDVIEAKYFEIMHEANDIKPIEDVESTKLLPYGKWMDLEAMMKATADNPSEFIKYLLVIALDKEYESGDMEYLEAQAAVKAEMPTKEALNYWAFFHSTDPKLSQSMSLYSPRLKDLVEHLQPAEANNLSNATE